MSSIRSTFVVVTGTAAMAIASVAYSGTVGSVLDKMREREAPSSSSSAPPPPRSSAPVYSAPSAAPQPAPQRSSPPRSDNNARDSSGNRGVIGNVIERRLPANGNGNGNGGNGGGRGNHGDHDHDGNHHRPPRTVYVLPPVYNDYYWNGSRYYNFDGGWYSPYGGSYVSVGAPYGLFVRTLPGYSSSFYYGNSRYYYNDDTYYLYEPRRGGYVVSPSPYGDEEDGDADEDFYIYPAQAQSEQQQADDRYACHKWAVKESGYDPIDGEYDRDRRAGYVRAITACLTGRGYSVK